MYCKKCGNEIDNDSVFCSKCGEKLFSSTNTTAERENKGLIAILIAIPIIFFIIVTGIIMQDSCNNIGRDATNNDIEIEIQTDITTMSFQAIILPNVDINNLEIEIEFRDKNNVLLKTVTKNIGNVKKGVQVKSYIDSNDLGVSNLLKASKTVSRVISGNVPII